ncbi:MAG TPA: MoxR family ATPase [Candidatus Sulfomarinibacteraceae bacterium]|nr:MoxR family ATPase [Candidatus Sulfomarinibacteraceae bacterium]
MKFESIDALQTALHEHLYVAERGLATAIFLALKLQRPLFLEGEAGVGKTEVAKVVADLFDTDLIRLQCYEGLDVNHAVYEWNYTRQILHLRLLEARGERPVEADLFDEEFLLKRPLLQAIENSRKNPPVLLIDEIDRSDEEFEAYLLEVLSDFQITIPELGTVYATHRPYVVLTSNRTREVHDALKRRCLYYWIDYPTFEKEMEIVQARLPEAPPALSRQVTAFVQELRDEDLYKIPGVAETLDWLTALNALNQKELDPAIVDDTLGVILKYQDDVAKVQGETARRILDRARMKV